MEKYFTFNDTSLKNFKCFIQKNEYGENRKKSVNVMPEVTKIIGPNRCLPEV